jgi:hypothetical protein
MPILKVGEYVRRMADASSLGASCYGPARRLTSTVHVADAVTLGRTAISRRGDRPPPQLRRGPVPLARVGAVIHDSLAAERAAWPSEERDLIRTEVLLLAGHVEDLGVGLYRPGRNEFAAVQSWEEHRLTWIRSSYGYAPALLLVYGDLGAALSAGRAGYRSLLQRAGLLGHAAWLSAKAAGLTGSISSRPHCQAAAVAQPSCGLWHLLTVALGGGIHD